MHGVQKLGQLVEPLPTLPRVAGTLCYHLSQLLDVICPHFFKRSLAFEAILWNCGEGIQTCKFSKWKSALASSWLNGIGYFEVTRSHFETDTASCLLHWWMCVCSVVSDSVWPHRLQPARPLFLCPWDFSSQNTGMGCQFLLWGIFLTQGLNLRFLHLLYCRRALYHWATGESLMSKYGSSCCCCCC